MLHTSTFTCFNLRRKKEIAFICISNFYHSNNHNSWQNCMTYQEPDIGRSNPTWSIGILHQSKVLYMLKLYMQLWPHITQAEALHTKSYHPFVLPCHEINPKLYLSAFNRCSIHHKFAAVIFHFTNADIWWWNAAPNFMRTTGMYKMCYVVNSAIYWSYRTITAAEGSAELGLVLTRRSSH